MNRCFERVGKPCPVGHLAKPDADGFIPPEHQLDENRTYKMSGIRGYAPSVLPDTAPTLSAECVCPG